jgi:5-methylthioadenosine/S-adenosylhomocysteine deaminase
MLFQSVTILNETFDITRDVDVRITGEKIEKISSSRLTPLPGERVLSGKRKLLMPGFANLHCHVPMTLLRGRGEGLDLHSWLTTEIFPFEAVMTPDDMQIGTALGLLEMIASGITTFTDMYFEICDMADVIEQSGMRVNLCHGISAGDGAFLQRKGVQDTLRLLERTGDNLGRVRVDMGLHAEYTSDEATVRGVADLAKEHGMIVHTHVSETGSEHLECKKRHGGLTPIGWLSHCGVLDNPVIAAHCVYVEEADLQIMAERDVTPVHCISSNLKLGSGVADLAAWKNAGLEYALGTDGTASNNNLNFLEELHLVSLVHKGFTGDPTFLSPKELLYRATRGGCLAQKRPESGLVKEGMDADLILIDFDRPHLLPGDDLTSHLCHSAQAGDVFMTIAGGDILYEDGEFLTLDRERIMREAELATDAIVKRVG